MNILVCGLGYVGSVTAACLLEDGHRVACVDTDPRVVAALRVGHAPVDEAGVAERFAAGQAAGRLAASAEMDAIAEADIAFICVGTPAAADGLELGDLLSAAAAAGRALRRRPASLPPLLLVVRSTILPGTMARLVLPALAEAAGEAQGARYQLLYHPEFMREGSAVADFRAPSRLVVGGEAEPAARLLALYDGIAAPRFVTGFAAAEAIKFADNSFHALKVAFANELGRYAMTAGIDVAGLFEMFVADTRLNISPAYLRPGAPFGGPCLGKDVGALGAVIAGGGGTAPVIDAIRASNAAHLDFLLAEIRRRAPDGGRVLLAGLTFKPGSSDLRGSALVELAERLIGASVDLSIYDPDVGLGAALPPALRARMAATAEGRWAFVIAAKPGVAHETSRAGVPTFRIDRL